MGLKVRIYSMYECAVSEREYMAYEGRYNCTGLSAVE
jgi:hypothetical protein